jgi:hypothetical protein
LTVNDGGIKTMNSSSTSSIHNLTVGGSTGLTVNGIGGSIVIGGLTINQFGFIKQF